MLPSAGKNADQDVRPEPAWTCSPKRRPILLEAASTESKIRVSGSRVSVQTRILQDRQP